MSLLTRTYTFTDGTTAYGSQVETEVANIVNTLNSLDQGNITWSNVKVTTLSPQANVNFGGNRITNIGAPVGGGDAAQFPITTGQIQGGTILGTNIASGTIAGSNIASATITGSNIAAGTIIASNIASGSITTTQIAATTIATSNMAANSITQNVSSNTTGTRGVQTEATNITLTTTGGPVLVVGNINLHSAAANMFWTATLYRDSTQIGPDVILTSSINTGTAYSQANFQHIDTPSAGAHTYHIYYVADSGGVTGLSGYSLQAVEFKK